MIHVFLLGLALSLAQDMPAWFGRGEFTSISGEFAETGEVRDSRLGGSVPLYTTPDVTVSAQARATNVELKHTPILRGAEVPKNFGSAEVGLTGSWQREGIKNGFSASIGSSGRSLMDENNSRALSLTYFTNWKSSEETSWYVLVSYATNRTRFVNIPLPGFIYVLDRRPHRLMLGFPFNMWMWSPGRLRTQVMGSPFSASAQVGYVVVEPWQAYINWSWQPRSFENLVPDIDQERLIYVKKETSAGIAFNPAPPILFSLAYVYQYDRSLYIGSSSSDRRSAAQLLSDSGGVLIRARLAF